MTRENNYYPFGLKHKGYNNAPLTNHPYKYNGKELNEELGLDWYDFGARNYDASLGRWMNIDPLALKYPNSSPYNYVLNSPLIYQDPDGRMVIVGNKNDRTKLLGFLHNIYGNDNFSFNDDNELQFNGNLKDFKGESKSTLKALKKVIDNDDETFVKLSNFSEDEQNILDEKGGASSKIVTEANGNRTSFILMDENKLKDLELFKVSFSFLDENGKPKTVGNFSDVPDGVTSFKSFSKILKNGKPQTVTGGGGSIGIMHEFFHVNFEGKNQRKINRFDNKVRNILGIPKRSVDDPEHSFSKD